MRGGGAAWGGVAGRREAAEGALGGAREVAPDIRGREYSRRSLGLRSQRTRPSRRTRSCARAPPARRRSPAEKARQRWWRRSRRGVQRAPSLCPAHLPTAAAGACGFRGGRGPRQMTHAIAAAGQLEGFHGGAGGAHTVEHRGGIRGAHTVEYRARAAKGTGRLQLASLARAHLCRGRVRVGQVAHAAQDGGLVRHERDLAA